LKRMASRVRSPMASRSHGGSGADSGADAARTLR
jgi:hypothetical protein